jgi:hypothetical protein
VSDKPRQEPTTRKRDGVKPCPDCEGDGWTCGKCKRGIDHCVCPGGKGRPNVFCSKCNDFV